VVADARKTVARAGRRTGEAVVETGSGLAESAKDAASRIGRTAGSAGKRVGEIASDTGKGIAGTSKYLAAGAVAAAVIGTAFERLRRSAGHEQAKQRGRDALFDRSWEA
jgi:hypothetical protein